MPDWIGMMSVKPVGASTHHAAEAVLRMHTRCVLDRPASYIGSLRSDPPFPEVRPVTTPRLANDSQMIVGEDPSVRDRPLRSTLRDTREAAALGGAELKAEMLQVLANRVVRCPGEFRDTRYV